MPMSRIAAALEGVERTLSRIERAAVAAALGLMLLLSFGQVVARNLFDTGAPEADVLVRHLVLFLAFGGGALAAGAGRHLHIELVSRFLPRALKLPALVVTQVGAASVCALLARAGWLMLSAERSAGTAILGDVPAWWAQAVFPCGFAWLALRFSIFAVRSAVERRAELSSPEAPAG